MYFLKLIENYDVRYLYIRILAPLPFIDKPEGRSINQTSLDFKNIYNKTSNLHPYQCELFQKQKSLKNIVVNFSKIWIGIIEFV